MDSMCPWTRCALCSLAGRFLVQSRTEIGWDIASTLAGAPPPHRPRDYGRARNDFIKNRSSI
jgi:hypothetical protein